MCNVISATEYAFPLVFIFPRANFKNHMINREPAESLGLGTKSGWMNTKSFLEPLAHFARQMHVTKNDKVLLIMDNHSSHVSLELQKMAKTNGLEIVTLLLHCSHKIQPLNVSVNDSFMRYYNASMK